MTGGATATPVISDDALHRILLCTAGLREENALWWRLGEYASDDHGLRVYAPCSDFFAWGCSDVEPVTPETVAAFERAHADVARLGVAGPEAALLYCARMRGLRPQGACYGHLDRRAWSLFDDAGLARAIDASNPRDRPSEPDTGTDGGHDQHTPRYSIPAPPLGQRAASMRTIRRAMERTGMEYTDCLRWTVDAEGDLRLVVVAFDYYGEWTVETAELTDANVDEFVEAFDRAEAEDGVFSALAHDVAAKFVSAVLSTA